MNPRTLKAAIKSRLNPDERDLAMRAWRDQRQELPPSTDPKVVFCAPLMGRAMAEDWAVISSSVTMMINSLIAQTDQNWILLLTSQDRPDRLPEDPRIRFLPFTQDVTGMDKRSKVIALMEALPDVLIGADGYMHALDADDVLHEDVVAHMRRDNNARGYWHRWGGMIDAKSGTVARCGPRSLRYPLSRPFLSQCGSSAAIYVDFRKPRGYDEFASHFYASGHRNFLRVAKAHGVTLDAIPFASGLYVMNTGENMRDKRGLMNLKMDYLRQNALPPAKQAALRRASQWPTDA